MFFLPTICSEMKPHPTHALEALYKHSARVSERKPKTAREKKKMERISVKKMEHR